MKRKPHAFTKQIVGFHCCAHCGLVRLKNLATEKAVKQGCEQDD